MKPFDICEVAVMLFMYGVDETEKTYDMTAIDPNDWVLLCKLVAWLHKESKKS